MMAASSATTNAGPPQAPSANPAVNLRNPTPLSSSQEAEVRDLYYKRVRSHCAAEIKEFADCAINRTVTATWVCRNQRLAMNSCMISHATAEEQDRARDEWFSNRAARKREREKAEKEREQRRQEILELAKEDERRRTKGDAAKNTSGWWAKGSS